MSLFPWRTESSSNVIIPTAKEPDGYCYNHTVSIGDTNITRSVYFTKYLEWLGYAREEMVRSKVSTELIVSGDIILVTKNTAIAYLREYELYDQGRIFVTIGRVTRTTSVLCFRYLSSSNSHLYAVAKQLILFTNNKGNPIAIPIEYLKLPFHYKEHNEKEIDHYLTKHIF